MIHRTLYSDSVERTRAIGASFGAAAEGAVTVGLVGQLGAGKTVLVKGIAAGAGVADEKVVTSPTFSLVQEYAGRCSAGTEARSTGVYHLDLYRLESAEDVLALGFEELLCAEAIVVVEWADRFPEIMPEDAIWIELTIEGDDRRRIEFRAAGGAGARLLEQWEPEARK